MRSFPRRPQESGSGIAVRPAPVGRGRGVGGSVLLADVRQVFRKRILLILLERPDLPQVIAIQESIYRVVHVAIIRALQIRRAHKVEGERLGLRGIRSLHGRLIPGDAVVCHLDLIAIEVIQGDHFHRLALCHHRGALQNYRASRGELDVQRGFRRARLLLLPMPYQGFEFLQGFRSGDCCGGPCRRRPAHNQSRPPENFRQDFHGVFSLPEVRGRSRKIFAPRQPCRTVIADPVARPNLCVANPTIPPSNIPGSTMSQKKPILACKTSSTLSPAAIPIPATIPIRMERTFCEQYPIATPAISPFSSEYVITLPMIGASEGSRKPLNPSSRPSVPPTANPSMGFERRRVSSDECQWHRRFTWRWGPPA